MGKLNDVILEYQGKGFDLRNKDETGATLRKGKVRIVLHKEPDGSLLVLRKSWVGAKVEESKR